MPHIRVTFLTFQLLLALLFAACNSSERELELIYFDIKGFTKNQTAQLTPQSCTVVKTFNINGVEERQEIASSNDLKFWEKEFSVFLEHDINKPVLRDAYKITEEVTPEGYTVVTYTLNDLNQSGVVSMSVVYDSLEQVKSWESRYLEKNTLYLNKRQVEMTFSDDQNGRQLQNYSIKGVHKLVLKDSVHYQMLATLKY